VKKLDIKKGTRRPLEFFLMQDYSCCDFVGATEKYLKLSLNNQSEFSG